MDMDLFQKKAKIICNSSICINAQINANIGYHSMRKYKNIVV